MDTHDLFTQQVAEFNQRLSNIVNHQRRAFAMKFVDRLKQDCDLHNAPPIQTRSWFANARQWFLDHLAVLVDKYCRSTKQSGKPTVKVINAEYEVVTPTNGESNQRMNAEETDK